MEKTRTYTWVGQLPGGIKSPYSFNVYTKDTQFRDVPCIYIYSYLTSEKRWSCVYVGQTEQLQTRLMQHANGQNDTDKRIRSSGYTHIHVCQAPISSLDKMEKELLNNYSWVCNIQGN